MCFHNALTAKPKKVSKHYGVSAPDDLYEPMVHASGFTHPQWPVLSMDKPQALQTAYWGLIPSWVKTLEQAKTASNQNLNARSETVFEKPSFRDAIKTQRCIVPSTGFYEWRTVNKTKYPYFIFPEHGDIFSMAGICATWFNTQTGEQVNTFSILTTEANATLSFIHNVKQRMPVILHEDAIGTWLKDTTSEDTLSTLMKPCPDSMMQYFTVAKETVQYDLPGEQAPTSYIYPELNMLF